MSNLSVVKGSCLCGAVKISSATISDSVDVCHCNMCRKWSGGSLLAVECKGDVSFSGEEHITVYPSSKWAERGFCKHCGTHLFYRLKQGNQYHVPVGVFDNSKNLVLKNEIFIDEKPEYYSFANKTKKMTGAEVFAQFIPPST